MPMKDPSNHGIAMALPWLCHCRALAPQWHCNGSSMALAVAALRANRATTGASRHAASTCKQELGGLVMIRSDGPTCARGGNRRVLDGLAAPAWAAPYWTAKERWVGVSDHAMVTATLAPSRQGQAGER